MGLVNTLEIKGWWLVLKKQLFSRILPIAYVVLTILNVSRLGYVAGATILVANYLDEITPIIPPKASMYLCVVYIILIHIALIVSVILKFFEKDRPFYIVITIDFIIYIFCLICFESQGALSEKAFLYIPMCIIQAILFIITVFYRWVKRRETVFCVKKK